MTRREHVELTLEDRMHLGLTWCGPVAIVLVLVGFCGFAGFLPPPSPTMSARETQAMWQDHTDLKRLGLLMSVWGGCLYVLFSVSVTLTMRRLGPAGNVLSWAQIAMGLFAIAFFAWNFLLLAYVAYRPEQPAEVVRAFSDLGFLMTFAPVQPFCIQYAVIGIAILLDPSPRPIFARWVGYLNVWVAVLLIPAGFIPFFKEGPMAWNGLLGFWIAVGVFAIWFFVMFTGIRRSILERGSAAV